MRELALFAGAGGGLLASRLLGWTTVCACEIDPYARSVLLARQRDGHLERFPVWDDIRTFDGRSWCGAVDVVSGGFPCQAFSSAARGRNTAPDLWPQMRRVVSEVRPRYVFAENVQEQPIRHAAVQLTEDGYGCRLARVCASDLAGVHCRKRWWLVGDAYGNRESVGSEHVEASRVPGAATSVWARDPRERLRVPDGVAYRVDRVRAAGNGQVPAVAAFAWEILMERAAATGGEGADDAE